MTGFYTTPGFLGSHASLASDVSLVIVIVSMLLLTYGVRLARGHLNRQHHTVQWIAFVLNAIVVVLVMNRLFIANILPEFSKNIFVTGAWPTVFHAILGAAALILGLVVVLHATALDRQGKPLGNLVKAMRVSYGLYLAAALSGIFLYLITYVF